MLPCFDFPNFKATFSISIQAPENLVALSTMAEESSRPGLESGTTLHQFGITPKMSTYLIGVTVGHMVSSSAISSSGKNISVWSVPALADQHAVPLQVCIRLHVHLCPCASVSMCIVCLLITTKPALWLCTCLCVVVSVPACVSASVGAHLCVASGQ